MTPQQIKNEVEKGCRERGKFDGHGFWICGLTQIDSGTYYCPVCSAKLSILTEYDKSIKEMIERLRESVWLVNSSNDRTLELIYPDINNLIREKIDEFISKLEDDEVGK